MRLDHPRLSQYTARKLSCRSDAIDAPPLYNSQPCHQYWSGLLARWQAVTFKSVISQTKVTGLMAKTHLQYVNEYSGKLAQWQKSDGYPPSVCLQISQQWLDDEGVTEYLPFIISSG